MTSARLVPIARFFITGSFLSMPSALSVPMINTFLGADDSTALGANELPISTTGRLSIAWRTLIRPSPAPIHAITNRQLTEMTSRCAQDRRDRFLAFGTAGSYQFSAALKSTTAQIPRAGSISTASSSAILREYDAVR